AARERRDRAQALARGGVPGQLIVDRQPERERRRQLDDRATMSTGVITAPGVLREVIAVRRIRAAATAAAELRELAGAAAPTELGIAQVVEDRRRAPELGEPARSEIAGAHRHVGTGRDVAAWRDATVVLARRARAMRVVFQQRRRRVQLPQNAAKVRRTLRA